jgi:hypothetical protein
LIKQLKAFGPTICVTSEEEGVQAKIMATIHQLQGEETIP